MRLEISEEVAYPYFHDTVFAKIIGADEVPGPFAPITANMNWGRLVGLYAFVADFALKVRTFHLSLTPAQQWFNVGVIEGGGEGE